MLAIITYKSADNKCYQLENPEILATDVSNYNFQKCWRDMLANIIFSNADDNNYNYNFWRAPQQM